MNLRSRPDANTMQKKSKIKKKPTKKKNPNYDWITMLFLVPLFAAMDARAKLAEDATIPPSPPLDTSVFEKSYEMLLQLEESLVKSPFVRKLVSSDSCPDNEQSYICSDSQCGESSCDERRDATLAKRHQRYCPESTSESESEDLKRTFKHVISRNTRKTHYVLTDCFKNSELFVFISFNSFVIYYNINDIYRCRV